MVIEERTETSKTQYYDYSWPIIIIVEGVLICTSVSQVGDPWDFTFYPIFKLSTEAKLKPDIG